MGLANDLASTTLLATDKRVLVAPAMNVRMWLHPATRRNVAALSGDGVAFVGPDDGEMACGEFGPGRMAEPLAIVAAIERALEQPTAIPLPAGVGAPADGALAGRRVVVTSGPTYEPIDPVRFIGNRSSGLQGHAIAEAARAAGAEVTLISGPVALADPPGVEVVHVETARRNARRGPGSAARGRVRRGGGGRATGASRRVGAQKLKKGAAGAPVLSLIENPDILAGHRRPKGRPPGAGRWVRRRDRARRRKRARQAQAQGLRPDRRQQRRRRRRDVRRRRQSGGDRQRRRASSHGRA